MRQYGAVRVLFYNHTGLVSGAERSLLELVGGLAARGDVDVRVASPEGPLASRVARLGVGHLALPGTTASFKGTAGGLARASVDMARAARFLRGAARGFDLVHANSVRGGLIAGAARGLGGPPVVTHVRDALEEGPIVAGIRLALRSSSRVVAISRHVEVPLRLGSRVRVLHNPVDLARFDPARVDREAARAGLGVNDGAPLLGVIAQITPWKGQDDAIRALAGLDQPGARLLVVGETKFVGRDVTFDNPRFRAGLDELAESLGVAGAVTFTGEREDIPELLAALDLLLVPSWQEPFGRTVIEGMAMGRAVLATSQGGPAEVIRDGVDGRLLPPRQPERWAAAARELLADGTARRAMEAAARASAQRFDRDAYVERVLELYREVLAGR